MTISFASLAIAVIFSLTLGVSNVFALHRSGKALATLEKLAQAEHTQIRAEMLRLTTEMTSLTAIVKGSSAAIEQYIIENNRGYNQTVSGLLRELGQVRKMVQLTIAENKRSLDDVRLSVQALKHIVLGQDDVTKERA